MEPRQKLTMKDPIEVFCRIRWLEEENSPLCLKAKEKTTVALFQAEALQSSKVLKEVHYTFKEVFGVDTTQKEIFDRISLPMIEEVLQGGNGLIFTYGITSSGKTYTMTGTPNDGGLLPRSLDVIFNSIKDCQTPKFVFKSDRLNGFEMQSFSDAILEQQKGKQISNRTPMKTNRREKPILDRIPDITTISQITSGVQYAIFVSYVEIYNNYIYDLLEDSQMDPKQKISLNSKMLREDVSHKMYVFGVTESEIKTVEEALDLFNKGQLRRRVSQTALNRESSRSHSVFTIRVVQATLDPQGAEILLDKNVTQISQLSLVDLAGSERCLRTMNTGHKLRETGNINASLMTLRKCIEMLRESQTHATNKKIPYRESKLTHLFKNYFEGDGKIKMVVCVNPHADYFDEIVHVMKFAEMTQDVVITRSVSTPINLRLTPNRGGMYRENIKKAKYGSAMEEDYFPPTVYSLGPKFPSLTVQSDGESVYDNLIEFLTSRLKRRSILEKGLLRRQEYFRNNIIAEDQENARLKQEQAVLKLDLESRNQRLQIVEDRLKANEGNMEIVERQLCDTQEELENTKMKLQNANTLLSHQRNEVEKIKIKMQDKLASEKDRMKRIMERRLAEKHAELERKMCFTEERFRQLREILNADDWDFFADAVHLPVVDVSVDMSSQTSIMPLSTAKQLPSEPKLPKARPDPHVAKETLTVEAEKVFEQENVPPAQSEEIVAKGSRHKRSRSKTGGKWIEHKPVGNLNLDTIFQSTLKNRKSGNTSELKVKDFTKPNVSKYVLEHQEEDSSGELELQLYKGDVINSTEDGAQIIFKSVEQLKTMPLPAYNLRKRSVGKVPLGEINSNTSNVLCESPSKMMKTG